MFKIEWDKEEVRAISERISGSHHQHMDCFSLGTLFQVVVNGVDVSGLAERQSPPRTRLMELFLGTFSIFRSIDPEKLRDKPFHFYYNVDNAVLGGEFRYYVQYDRSTDLVTIEYIYTGKKVFKTLQIPLKDLATGIIQSAEEMIEEVLSVSKVCEDTSYYIFKADLDIIKEWYHKVYGEDAGCDRLNTEPSYEGQKSSVVTTDHPGAVQMIWNRKKLEDSIRVVSATHYDPETWKGFEMVFHFFIDDVDIIGGALTYFDFLFVNINWVFHRLDPEHIAQEKMHFASDEPEAEVSGTGFEFTVTLLSDHETLLVDYMSAQMNYHAQTTVPLRRFTRAVVQANEEFLRETWEVWPEVVLTDEYRCLIDDIATLREWYRERYHEEIPPR